jgi:hypothetical protein
MNIVDWVTLITAIWGSITGTIAIILRIRDSAKDQPDILVLPRFEYSDGFELRPKVSLVVELTNKGRRTTTLDSIHAVYWPHQWWKVPIWKMRRLGRRWLSNPQDRKYHRVLDEGRHCEFRFGQNSIWPNPQFDPVNLRRIIARDKVGREWSSSSKFGQHQIREYRQAESILTNDLENNDRKFEIRLHKIAGELLIKARFLLDKRFHYYRESYNNLKAAKEDYYELLGKGEAF